MPRDTSTTFYLRTKGKLTYMNVDLIPNSYALKTVTYRRGGYIHTYIHTYLLTTYPLCFPSPTDTNPDAEPTPATHKKVQFSVSSLQRILSLPIVCTDPEMHHLQGFSVYKQIYLSAINYPKYARQYLLLFNDTLSHGFTRGIRHEKQ